MNVHRCRHYTAQSESGTAKLFSSVTLNASIALTVQSDAALFLPSAQGAVGERRKECAAGEAWFLLAPILVMSLAQNS